MLSFSRCSIVALPRSYFIALSNVRSAVDKHRTPHRTNHFGASTMGLSQMRGMARYQGPMPTLSDKEFVILTPEVSGPGGMSVPAELGEVCELSVKVGDFVKEDAVVAVIDTCKASVEARCRATGVVTRVLASVGEVVFELQPLYVVEQRS